jgi:ArsR family transcriptional regulator
MNITLKRKKQLEARTKMLKALAHPSRLLIVEELTKKDMCVFDLTNIIEADTSTVSKHLSVLKNASIIIDEKKGQQVFYKMNICCILNFLNCADNVIKENK